MALKSDVTPTVRAYEYGNTIIVKYYDTTGASNSLACPLCHWIGPLELSGAELYQGFSEFRCPDCNTKLARLSHSFDS